jgi:hypothetical protein
MSLRSALCAASNLSLCLALLAAASADARLGAAALFSKKRWSSGGKGAAQHAGPRYWRLRFFDDFKGRPSDSERDRLCYDQLPVQCHIWAGASSYRCDLAHLSESDRSMVPPLRENLAAVLRAVDPSRNWAVEPLAKVKARYAQLLAERTRHLDKCTWTLYHMLNWMSTDYQGNYAARFDGLAVRVLPEGEGYLELSAFRAPLPAHVREQCRDNIVYSPELKFNDLACKIVNGGLMSMRFPAPEGSPPRGFLQQYGRFEVKMRIPRGEGAFPAAWLMPEKGAWPYSGGEIDIIEARDNADEIYQTYHHGKCYRRDPAAAAESYLEALTYWDEQGNEAAIESVACGGTSAFCVASYRTTTGATGKNPRGPCGERFALRTYTGMNVSLGHTEKQRPLAPYFLQDHVFAVEWTPERLDYYLGTRRTHTVAVGSKPTANYATGGGQAGLPPSLAALGPHNFPTSPFYFILNHSTWVRPERRAAFLPQRVLVDYVKAYSACTTAADLCPCGGNFVEGRTCALGAAVPACPRGEVANVQGGHYPSPCARLDVPEPSLGDKVATALAALRDVLGRRLAALREAVLKVWNQVAAFFSKLRHWVEPYAPCVRNHVVPLGRRLADGVAAAARSQLAAFWQEAAPSLAGLSAAEKRAALQAAWNDVLAGFGARFDEARARGVGQVRGWFNQRRHRDGAEAELVRAFDPIRAAFDREAAESFAAQTR